MSSLTIDINFVDASGGTDKVIPSSQWIEKRGENAGSQVLANTHLIKRGDAYEAHHATQGHIGNIFKKGGTTVSRSSRGGGQSSAGNFWYGVSPAGESTGRHRSKNNAVLSLFQKKTGRIFGDRRALDAAATPMGAQFEGHPGEFHTHGTKRSFQQKDPRTGKVISMHGPFGYRKNAEEYARGMGLNKKSVRSRQGGFTVEE